MIHQYVCTVFLNLSCTVIHSLLLNDRPNFWYLLVHIPNLCMKSLSNFPAAFSWIFIPSDQLCLAKWMTVPVWSLEMLKQEQEISFGELRKHKLNTNLYSLGCSLISQEERGEKTVNLFSGYTSDTTFSEIFLGMTTQIFSTAWSS